MRLSICHSLYLISYFDWKAASEELADDEKKLENIEDMVIQCEHWSTQMTIYWTLSIFRSFC